MRRNFKRGGENIVPATIFNGGFMDIVPHHSFGLLFRYGNGLFLRK